jgi:hypothetical protein
MSTAVNKPRHGCHFSVCAAARSSDSIWFSTDRPLRDMDCYHHGLDPQQGRPQPVLAFLSDEPWFWRIC